MACRQGCEQEPVGNSSMILLYLASRGMMKDERKGSKRKPSPMKLPRSVLNRDRADEIIIMGYKRRLMSHGGHKIILN